MSHNPHLLHALGTRHCPNGHFPLFANPYAPGEVGGSAARERWLGDFVMLVDDALSSPQRLIACAEALPLWARAAVVGDGATDTEPEIAARRSNDLLSVTGFLHPDLTEHEQHLQRVFHPAACRYVRRVGRVTLNSDLGFELLRYSPGQRFTEHLDSMPGSPSMCGQRLLSAVLFLNDDYQGGELHFPRQGLTYNPRAGSLLLFPSNFCYPHESPPSVPAQSMRR